jgi:hypothetical protein
MNLQYSLFSSRLNIDLSPVGMMQNWQLFAQGFTKELPHKTYYNLSFANDTAIRLKHFKFNRF